MLTSNHKSIIIILEIYKQAEVIEALERDLTIDITTIGRSTGERRRIEIWFLNINGSIYITGTPGPRDWYANVLSDPSIVFHLKESIKADLKAKATVVGDLERRRTVFESEAAHWYRANADNDELIAAAPMVQITFL